MGKSLKFPIILISICAGLLTAYAISTTLYYDDLDSFMSWGGTIALLTLGFSGVFFMLLPNAWERFSSVSTQTKLWGAALAILSAVCFSISLGILFLIPLIVANFILISWTVSSLQSKNVVRFITAWACSGLASFFAVGFLKNFHPSFLEFLFITLASNFFLSWIFEDLLNETIESPQNKPLEKLVSILPLTVGFVLFFLVLQVVTQHPKFFFTELLFTCSTSRPHIFWPDDPVAKYSRFLCAKA